jgi:hypothetical protein
LVAEGDIAMTEPIDPHAVMDANDGVSAGDAAIVLLDGLHLLTRNRTPFFAPPTPGGTDGPLPRQNATKGGAFVADRK